MIKVFIQDKPLIFCESKEQVDASFSPIESLQAFDKITFVLSDQTVKGAYFISNDTKKALSQFAKNFSVLEAAGGVVMNYENKFLLIERMGKWDIPKGKIEPIESPKHAALREVCEETGVCDLEIIEPLKETYHTYVHKDKNILKRTYWYLMKCNSFSDFVPQQEEQITDARWMNKEEVKEAMQNSYTSIVDLMEEVLKK